MAQVTIIAKIKGKDCNVIIDSDPPWGKMQKLFNASIVPDGNGGQRIDMNNFFDTILETAIIGGLPFEPTNRTEWKELPTSEMTYLLGEITAKLPLETYLANLKLDSGILKTNQ